MCFIHPTLHASVGRDTECHWSLLHGVCGARWPRWQSVGLLVEGTRIQNHLVAFLNLGCFVQPTLMCLLEEKLKAVKNLVSMPGKVKDGINV